MDNIYISVLLRSEYSDFSDFRSSLDRQWQNILHNRCDCGPIEIQTDSSGKPRLLSPAGWFYNISHSGNIGISALAGQEVGIDIEHMSKKRNRESIAQSFFSEKEHHLCREKPEYFYTLWTRKEAWIKRMGLSVWQMKSVPDVLDDTESLGSWYIRCGEEQYALSLSLDGSLRNVKMIFQLPDSCSLSLTETLPEEIACQKGQKK